MLLETSLQVSLSLDLLHVHHKPQTYLFDTAKLIPQINLGALISHNTSRSLQHIQLRFFWVGLLSMSFFAFLPLLVFHFV